MNKFYVDDCPKELPVALWIQGRLQWQTAINDVMSTSSHLKSKHGHYNNIEHKFKGNLLGLQQAVAIALDRYGFFGWKSSEGDELNYGGFSITYNPNLQYEEVDIHQSNLGTKVNSPGEFYHGSIQHHKYLKDSYFDGHSFNEFTPAAKIGYMGEFLSEVNRNMTVVRSRLGILRGVAGETRYHRDSSIFEMVRLNIPVTGDDSFVFQFEGQDSYVLETGKAYNWDTYKSHRVMCVKDTEMYRANMVIGLSPWLTYNKEERYWYPNEYFGKKHPFDIFIEGRVTDKIEFLRAW